MADFELNAELREDTNRGKGAARRMRRHSDQVPAILYGAGKKPLALALHHKDLHKACESESFFSQIIKIHADGKSQEVILKDLQRHPAKDRILHADFMRIQMDVAITVDVPLHFINEDKCVGVRQEGGLVSHNMASLEVTCLPGDLPEFIEVDVLDLGLGGAIHISELTLPPGVTVPSLQLGDDHDHVVVSVHARRVEVEPIDQVDEAAEGEAPEGEEAKADEDKADDEGGEG